MSAIDQTTTQTIDQTASRTTTQTGSATEQVRTTVLRSSEFTCPSCVRKIEKRLSREPGVVDATVHFSTGRVEVRHDASVNVQQLVAAVADVGYRVVPSAF